MHNEHHHGVTYLVSTGTNPLKVALVIVVVIMVAEVVGGILSNSLALIGDAGHMLVDAFALALSLVAMNLSKRPATATRTFGYHRVEILAALANGTLLGALSLYILYEAYQRFLEPPEIKTPLMLTVAVIGLIANLVGILLLRRGSHGSLNIRGAFLHIVGDGLSSVGVIIGGIIIAYTGLGIVDPIIAVLISIIILWGAVRLVKESVDILAEVVPKDIQVDKVAEAIRNIGGVEDVHDIHIWTITSGMQAMSAHLRVEDRMVSDSTSVLEAVNKDLAERFNITHTTLQLECESCASPHED
ncbi:MAG: cation diffusion facilitator family transporter [Chloroflexota bacterium]